MPRTFFSKTMPHSACKSTFSDLRYLTFTRFFDGTPRVRAPAASRFLSQLFALFHLLPSRRQYLSSFVRESTHKIATFREDLVTAPIMVLIFAATGQISACRQALNLMWPLQDSSGTSLMIRLNSFACNQIYVCVEIANVVFPRQARPGSFLGSFP